MQNKDDGVARFVNSMDYLYREQRYMLAFHNLYESRLREICICRACGDTSMNKRVKKIVNARVK